MQAQGVLFGQIAAVFGIVIAGVWSATQWTAAALGYQLRLGSPWFDFFGTPVYHPWRLFEWWFFFDAYAPHVFDIGGAIAGGSGLVAVVVAIAMSVWRSRQSRLVTTYGSARWADADDVRKAGLTQPAGVFLGLHRGQYLRHEGPEHVLTFAPTRSGKGVGLVVPTLLSWPASVVVHDIKGENWTLTAGWRSRFSHCLLFVNWLQAIAWDVHTFVLPILGHERGMSASTIGALLGAFAIAAAGVRMALPLIAEKLPEWKVMYGATLLAACALMVYPLMPGALTMGVCSVVLGVALGAVQPMVLSLLHQVAPPQRQGEAMALRVMTINFSSFLMPMLFGSIGAVTGVAGLFWLVCGALALGARAIPALQVAEPPDTP